MSEASQHATGGATRRDAARDAQSRGRAQAAEDVKTDALAAARELSPIITRLRHETEASRRLAGPIVERLVDTRLCRMAVAKSLQGLELPVAESCEVYEVLARAEASVAWIVWNNSLPCFFGRFLEKSARNELFGDPRWLYASSTRPTGRATVDGDGYRVNGRWALVSGCELAEWMALMCVVEENGKTRMIMPDVPEIRILFLRRGDYDILDTWHVGGLRGTGSHDVVVKDKHVPGRWSLSPDDASTLEGTIGRIPMVCTMAAGFASQMLGLGQLALDTLVQLAATKVSPDPGPALGARQAVLASIARQAAALAAARAHLRSCTSKLWETVSSGAPPPIEGITAVWAAALHAVDAGRSTVETMYAAGGTSSLYTDCPLERTHRDMHAMLRHIVSQTFWLEDAGRVTLGVAPTHPMYAL
jgi:alkylation response protein AidB-like acyl-CoA dehydrogenase